MREVQGSVTSPPVDSEEVGGVTFPVPSKSQRHEQSANAHDVTEDAERRFYGWILDEWQSGELGPFADEVAAVAEMTERRR